jgi:hypothetical protein
VVAAEIELGQCADFGDVRFTGLLEASYQDIVKEYASQVPPLPIPVNEPLNRKTGDPDEDLKLRKLDRLVIDNLVDSLEMKGVVVQTVRAPFEEGEPAFAGAKIRMQSHVQIAVRDRDCIGRRVCLIPETI